MPDNELKISVKVADKEQLDSLWQKFEAGKATLADVTRLKKEMNAAFKGEIIGSADYNKFAGQLATINDLQRDVRIQTKAGHEAYFKAGLEVRQLALSSGLLKGALGGVTSELANSVLNAVQLKQALVPLGISMGGVGIAIAAIVAMLPAMISLLSKSADQVERNKRAMDLWSESIKEAKIETLNEELNRLQLLLAEILSNNAKLLLFGPLGSVASSLLGKDPAETIKRIDEVQKKLVEMNRELSKKEREEQGKAFGDAESSGKGVPLSIQIRNAEREIDRSIERGRRNRKKTTNEMFEDELRFSNFTQQTLGNAFSGVFQQAGQDLRQFLGVEGHSVIQLLIADVAQLGLKLAETAMIAQFLSFLFPGAGGFGAIFQGMTGIPMGGGGAKGGSSGSTVSSVVKNAAMSRGGNSGGGMQPFVQVIPLISNSGLSVQVEVGNRINRGRRQ